MRACYICKKSYNTAVSRLLLRGKYNPTGTKKQKANLKPTSKLIPGKRVYVCVQCLKSMSKKAQSKVVN